MTAAAYVRKSNDEGSKASDVKSIAVQLAEIKKFAEGEDTRWTIGTSSPMTASAGRSS